jgi:hypothetical protein
MSKLYACRPTEDFGDLYLRHVMAMTAEGLHEKSAIAAELAFRDLQIEKLRKMLADQLIPEIKEEAHVVVRWYADMPAPIAVARSKDVADLVVAKADDHGDHFVHYEIVELPITETA